MVFCAAISNPESNTINSSKARLIIPIVSQIQIEVSLRMRRSQSKTHISYALKGQTGAAVRWSARSISGLVCQNIVRINTGINDLLMSERHFMMNS
jgi:hypothetical protein